MGPARVINRFIRLKLLEIKNSSIIILLSKRYYFSTFEDDNLLCILDDTAYSQDEIRINVIPEQYNVESKQVINLDLKDLIT